ncbi:hypothetical protein FACS18948_7060 [Clostridia bacterium]|nr:hypothetical protein FACS18948_7060 [Clostridia bacterium]
MQVGKQEWISGKCTDHRTSLRSGYEIPYADLVKDVVRREAGR